MTQPKMGDYLGIYSDPQELYFDSLATEVLFAFYSDVSKLSRFGQDRTAKGDPRDAQGAEHGLILT